MTHDYEPAPLSAHSHTSSHRFSIDEPPSSAYSHQTGEIDYSYPAPQPNAYGYPDHNTNSYMSASSSQYIANSPSSTDHRPTWGHSDFSSRDIDTQSTTNSTSGLNPFARPRKPESSSFNSSLLPPSRPFVDGEQRPLSINYLPSKFSGRHVPGQYAHRRKVGGGRGAWAEHEARMPDDDALDPDGYGISMDPSEKPKKKHKLVWNRFKWIIFMTNTVLMMYSIAGLVAILLVWFNVWDNADVVRVGNQTPLILSTIAASFCLLTSLVGYAGIVLNNRSFLAVYTLMCWICFALVVTPGYVTYKNYAFNLEGKVNKQWSRDLGQDGRLRVQNTLNCCGYYSPFVEATISATCYSRANLQGCKGKYWRFERKVLHRWWTISFSLVPVQLMVIIAALLCSNHVTYRFGKGLTPKRYRLNLDSLAFIMDGYAGEIAAAYGPSVAAEAINRSSTNLDQLVPSAYSKSKSYSSGFNSPFQTSNMSKSTLSEGFPMTGLNKDEGSREDGWYSDRT